MHPHPRHTRSKALVGIGIVAVIGAGLGAYFGIRGVEGAGSAPSGGQPPARTDAAMAYDAADGTVVMFGGEGRSGSLGDTWTWNGSAWTQAHPATSPPALTGAQMTYDPVSHDVLLVGGQRVTGAPLGGAVCDVDRFVGFRLGRLGLIGFDEMDSAERPPQPADAPAPGGNAQHSADRDRLRRLRRCKRRHLALERQRLDQGRHNHAVGRLRRMEPGDRPGVRAGPCCSPTGRWWSLTPRSQSRRSRARCRRRSPTAPTRRPAPSSRSSQNQSWVWTGHAWQAIKNVPNTAATDVLGSRVITDAVTGQLAIFGNGFFPSSPRPARRAPPEPHPERSAAVLHGQRQRLERDCLEAGQYL